MSSILITRPLAKAEETARDIVMLGFNSMISPVLDVEPVSFEMPDASGCGGLLFTSAHGVECFVDQLEAQSPFYDVIAYCVGDHTAQAARQAGFENVMSASGEVDDLVDMVVRDPASLPYLHVRGKHVSAPLHVLLGACDVQVNIVQVYDTVFAPAFSEDALQAFRLGHIQAVMLYSSRSAESFAALVDRHDLAGALASVKVLSISDAVLGYVQSYPWMAKYVAKKPDRSSLYALLQDVCA